MHNLCDNSCHICKSNSEYCCGFCHKFFCNDCFETHLPDCKFYIEQNHYLIRSKRKNKQKLIDFDLLLKYKNSIYDFPKDWEICE